MLVKELRKKKFGLDKNELDLIILNEIAPGEDKSFLTTHEDIKLDDGQMKRIEFNVDRRKNGEPLAYILGYKEFYGRKFLVDSRALIPRPETEALIDLVKELNLKSILEVGTGSGCIAVTLALELPDARIVGLDNSENALMLARDNAIEWRLLEEWDHPVHSSEWFGLMYSDLLGDLKIRTEVIVANLPYVDKKWDWLDKKALAYEPAEALYAKDEGLALIKKLIHQAARRKCTKYLVLEADPCQHEKIAEYAKTKGFDLVKTKDFGLVFKFNR